MVGCAGADAEYKEIAGNGYACFNLAHSEKVRGEKRTTWVRVRKLDKDNVLAQWITKGKPLYVEGRPQVSTYVAKDGQTVAELTLWADRLEFIAGASTGETAAVGRMAVQAGGYVNRQTAGNTGQECPYGADAGDDLPF